MQKTNLWYPLIERTIENQKQISNKKDIKFFNIDMLLQAAKLTDLYAQDCEKCRENKKDIEHISGKISQMLDTIKGRKQYEKTLDKVLKHLKKQHGIYPKNYFTGLFAFIGTIFGLLIGFLAVKMSGYENLLKFSMLTIGGLGLILGYISGKIKDNKLNKSKKVL